MCKMRQFNTQKLNQNYPRDGSSTDTISNTEAGQTNNASNKNNNKRNRR